MKCYFILVMFVFSLATLSMAWVSDESLLSFADIEMMQDDREKGPAFSAPLDGEVYWESFNEWQCFSVDRVSFSCDEIKYEHWKKVPLLTVMEGDRVIEFAVSPDFDWNCEQTLEDWDNLFENGSNFCVYGAYLQDIEHLDGGESEYWYINRIKIGGEYWVEWKERRLGKQVAL